ncbi:MAG TPA: sterol desaturase family protein [Candidatus Acidoferrales bacterium]|jgi:putative flippase GtrA|nr:sterol desaturase family protein [Candidatus Acidoferrales bacterium]
MVRPIGSRSAEIARARAVKRRNAITALLIGTILTILIMRIVPLEARAFGPLHLLAGFFAGLLYANAFEYILHRFALHWGHGFLVQRHGLHHDTTGAAEEPRYVNFATSPWVVVLVFVLNAVPVLSLEFFLHTALTAGILAGFTLYFIAYEEIHWRFHLGGWLPGWMRSARHHHMLHHGGFEGRYNVFLPIFDWIFHRNAWKQTSFQQPR